MGLITTTQASQINVGTLIHAFLNIPLPDLLSHSFPNCSPCQGSLWNSGLEPLLPSHSSLNCFFWILVSDYSLDTSPSKTWLFQLHPVYLLPFQRTIVFAFMPPHFQIRGKNRILVILLVSHHCFSFRNPSSLEIMLKCFHFRSTQSFCFMHERF